MPRASPLSSAFKTACLKLKIHTILQIVTGLPRRLLFSDQENVSLLYKHASVKRVFHASSIKPFCFAPLLFLTFRRMSCLRQKSKWSRKNSSDQRQSLVFISRRLTGDARYTKSIYVLLSRSIVWSLLCYCVRNREHCCVLCDVARNFFFTVHRVMPNFALGK